MQATQNLVANRVCRLARLEEFEAWQRLLTDAKLQMAQAGFQQWDDTYPTVGDFEADVRAQRLWWFGSGCEACLTILPVGCSWHLHRVMVSSAVAHHGVATTMLTLVQQWATQAGVIALEVGTHHDNLAMRRVLERLGYRAVTRYLAPGRAAMGEMVRYQLSLSSDMVR